MLISLLLKKQTIILVIVMGILFHQVFQADYAYLDDIHQLWYNQGNLNLIIFAKHGRLIGGWMMNVAFGTIDTISELKFIRIVAFGGWVGFILLWQYCTKQWNRYLNLPEETLFFSTLFIICCPSLAIYIGWAACFQTFMGFITALLAGHILFMHLYKQGDTVKIPLSKFLLIGLLSCTSLFIYQITYAVFLLPFFFHFVFQKREIHKKLVIPFALYLLFSGLYYLLFQYSLKQLSIVAADRTDITFDIVRKISFFIAHVFSEAFSFNILYSPKSIFSQAFYPFSVLVLILLLYSTDKKIKTTSRSVLLIFGMLFFFYAPLMATKENFASFRTMLAGTLAVSVAIFGLLVNYIKNKKPGMLQPVAPGFYVLLFIMGYYNFNNQFINPLPIENKLVAARVATMNIKPNDTIVFIRPDEHIYRSLYHITVYKDEFGLPSTHKDWVPDPLIRQLVYENKKDRELAKSLTIQHYERKEDVPASSYANPFFIDMNEVLQHK